MEYNRETESLNVFNYVFHNILKTQTIILFILIN